MKSFAYSSRILSVFNLLKRVGFVVLLLPVLLSAQEWRQVRLTETEWGVKQAEVVSDTFGNLHIYYLEASYDTIPGPTFEYCLKFIYVDGNGDILMGPIILSPFLDHPAARDAHVAGDGRTNSWCVWSDTLIEQDSAKGVLLAHFDASTQTMQAPLYLGEDHGEGNVPSRTTDLTYQDMDHTLHLIGTHYLFFGFHSKFSASGDVLAWQEPVDSIFISEEVSAVTSTTGDVWAVYRNEVPGGIEALFVRMNEDGSQTVRRPFGAAPEFFSYANSLTTAPNGDICCCASVSGGHTKRYCRLDSTLAVVEWHDLVVNDLVLRNAIASNNAGQVFVTWSEEPSPGSGSYSIYASTYDPAEGWISDGAEIASQLRPFTYFDACPISDENEWAVVGCVLDSGGSPFYPDLYLFTTDTATSVSSNNARLVNSQMFTTYPNPFNSTLSISLEIPLHQEVTISLYDLLGREVDVIQRGRLESATLSYSAPASLASGIYFVRAVTAHDAVMRKVVLLK